jgi:divalent metal cation (Fe/Co/Zn/Cd) transporter
LNERLERFAELLRTPPRSARAAYDALTTLLGLGDKPEHSGVGLVLVVLSVVVMPTLAWAKRRVAAGLGSVALKADAAETQLCTYLSVVVLLVLCYS